MRRSEDRPARREGNAEQRREASRVSEIFEEARSTVAIGQRLIERCERIDEIGEQRLAIDSAWSPPRG
jgi:hypothetical protein